jgi:hypothetical protein
MIPLGGDPDNGCYCVPISFFTDASTGGTTITDAELADVASSCPQALPPEITNNLYSCPAGYVLGVDQYNAVACCAADSGAGAGIPDASLIDTAADVISDGWSEATDAQ